MQETAIWCFMDDRIKIFYLVDRIHEKSQVGGTERQTIELIRELNRERFAPCICCLRGTADDLDIDLDCHSSSLEVTRVFSIDGMRSILRLAKVLGEEEIAIVHTVLPDSHVVGMLAAAIAGVPVVLSSRRDLGFWYTWRNLPVLRLLDRFVDGIVVNSGAVKDVVMRREHVKEGRIEVIRNGLPVDLSDGEIEGFRGEVRRRLKIPDDTRVVGIVSNFSRRVKRVDLFIEAARIVLESHEKVLFLIIGDGYLFGELRGMIEGYGLTEKVRLMGFQENPLRCACAFDIAVNSSDSEGFSNSILEYMLAGRPIVATGNSGNREMIGHDVNGLLVPVGEAKPLADEIVRLMDDGDLRRRLGARARLEVKEKYSLEKMVAAHESLYERLLRTKG